MLLFFLTSNIVMKGDTVDVVKDLKIWIDHLGVPMSMSGSYPWKSVTNGAKGLDHAYTWRSHGLEAGCC